MPVLSTEQLTILKDISETPPHQIEPGDRLMIRNLNWLSPLFPDPSSSGQMRSSPTNDSGYEVTVNKAGSISMPEIGFLKVVNLTSLTLADTLTVKYQNTINNPLFEVTVTNLQVQVLGAVSQQGVYALSDENQTLGLILAKAGGIRFTETSGKIQIIRQAGTSQRVIEFSIETLADPRILQQPIYHKDVIYLPPSQESVRSVKLQRNLVVVQPFIILLNFTFLILTFLSR
jgi:polysaccharide export outer membrane protein